ncbi:MAG: N-formylglutamate amidohydrolase [Pseudomonadota bacterium]
MPKRTFSKKRSKSGDASGAETPRVIEVVEPARLATPLIVASPHSGRHYPAEFLRISRLDRHALRQSEDGYVDLIFDAAPRYGAPFLRALFPRAYVDVNRSADELDQRMFADALPGDADVRSSRVLAGLGVIPRIVADGHDIYARKLKFADAKRRLSTCYEPYHKALNRLIERSRAQFGCAILIDCHSMPSAGGAPLTPDDRAIDFVLGDRFGAACAPALVALVEQNLSKLGFSVSRNAPYAGGYVAASYGDPANGVHVLQIEINRSIYLDERRLTRTAAFDALRGKMQTLLSALSQVEPAALTPAIAAE